MALQHAHTRAVPRLLRALPVAHSTRGRAELVELALLRHVAEFPAVALRVILFPNAAEVPQAHRTVLTAGQADVVLDLHAFDRASVAAQPAKLLARKKIEYPRVRVVQ